MSQQSNCAIAVIGIDIDKFGKSIGGRRMKKENRLVKRRPRCSP